jgi:hypothetical protein
MARLPPTGEVDAALAGAFDDLARAGALTARRAAARAARRTARGRSDG